MKRWILGLLLSLSTTMPISAQSWQSLLRDAMQMLTGKSTSTTTSATTSTVATQITASALVGEWSYLSPAMEYSGTDMLATLAVSTLKSQLVGYYQQAGLQAGQGTLTFCKDGTFRAVLTDRNVEGTYSYDATAGTLQFNCIFDDRTASFTGSTSFADGALTLLFDANTTLSTLRSLPRYAQSQKLAKIATLLEGYPGVLLGATIQQ
jgi:hypothetical protein